MALLLDATHGVPFVTDIRTYLPAWPTLDHWLRPIEVLPVWRNLDGLHNPKALIKTIP